MNKPVRHPDRHYVTDDVEAIRLSIGKSIADDDYEDAETVFARLRERFRAVDLVGGEAAFQSLAQEVEADPALGVGEVDAFEFLHALKASYDSMADARDERA